MSDHEITWARFNSFDQRRWHDGMEKQFSRQLTLLEPAFAVRWFAAVAYCRWLTVQGGMSEADQCYDDPKSLPKDGEGNPLNWPFHANRRGFRLLTEAEWECVCRGGTTTAYSYGNDEQLLARSAWFADNSAKWFHAAGQLRPNLRGVFDLHGNLYEWCHDWFEDNNYVDNASDPIGPDQSSTRVTRGGAWNLGAEFCRSARRAHNRPSYLANNLGFRVTFVLPR